MTRKAMIEIYNAGRYDKEKQIMDFLRALCVRISAATAGWIAVLLCLLDGQHC